MIDHYDRPSARLHITKVNVRALPITTMAVHDFRSADFAWV